MNSLLRILQVEDSPEDQMMTAEALNEASPSTELRSVSTSKEAIAVLGEKNGWRPNIILLDLSLPGDSGFGVLQSIKSQPDLKTLMVIVFSSSKAEVDINRAYELQANCYIPKPADFEGYRGLMGLLKEFELAHVQLPFRC
jgi:chemotaxis family two-component system response regulator Rcp1